MRILKEYLKDTLISQKQIRQKIETLKRLMALFHLTLI